MFSQRQRQKKSRLEGYRQLVQNIRQRFLHLCKDSWFYFGRVDGEQDPEHEAEHIHPQKKGRCVQKAQTIAGKETEWQEKGSWKDPANPALSPSSVQTNWKNVNCLAEWNTWKDIKVSLKPWRPIKVKARYRSQRHHHQPLPQDICLCVPQSWHGAVEPRLLFLLYAKTHWYISRWWSYKGPSFSCWGQQKS